MFVKSKLLGILISCILILSLSMGVSGAAFGDTEGHWAESVIDKWAERGIIVGFEGNFEPDAIIIRGEFAVIIDRLMKYTEMSVNDFADLDKDAYYTEAILKLNKVSVMLGYNGLISPEEYVTREEAFVMLNRAYDLGSGGAEITFDDKDEVSDWAYEAVSAMCEAGIINGNGDNKICPKDYITRAEVMQLIENISNLKNENDLSFIPDYVPNIGGLVVGDPYRNPNDSEFNEGNVSVDEHIVNAGKIEW